MYVGGTLEPRLPRGMLGATFSCIIAQQFYRLRHGDRFWYESNNDGTAFRPEQLHQIRKASLARLFCDNGDDIEQMQPDALELPSRT